jgi:hypothetical protein
VIATFAEFRHGEADVVGGQLHYRISGTGESVVLLHGWPQHSLQWHSVAPKLAKRYQVLVPDLPGCGVFGNRGLHLNLLMRPVRRRRFSPNEPNFLLKYHVVRDGGKSEGRRPIVWRTRTWKTAAH